MTQIFAEKYDSVDTAILRGFSSIRGNRLGSPCEERGYGPPGR
jgi:hypothetical protein